MGLTDKHRLVECFQTFGAHVAWDDGVSQHSFTAVGATVDRLRRSWRVAGVRAGARLIAHGYDAYETWLCALAAYGEGCSLALLPQRLHGYHF